MPEHEDDTDQATQHIRVRWVAAGRQRTPPALYQDSGPDAPRRVILENDRMVLGRAPEADLQVHSNSLSRLHAALVRTPDGFKVMDLQSTNGVMLNGVPIHSASLRHGDRIQLGDIVFIYEEGR